jgi:protein TonB
MFDRTLNSSWDERSHRGLATLTSLGLQALAVTVLLMLPLLRPQGLPSFHQLSTPISWGQPLAAPPRATRISSSTDSIVQNSQADIVFTMPSRIPTGIATDGNDAPPTVGLSGPAIPGTGGDETNGVRNLFESGSRPVLPAARSALPVAPLRISRMSEGNLVHKVQPAYPVLARTARIQGAVLLQAVISKAGAIENLKVLAGHPMLVRAALEAVSQWRYRPYILNGEPVEVETLITVNFSLAGN